MLARSDTPCLGLVAWRWELCHQSHGHAAGCAVLCVRVLGALNRREAKTSKEAEKFSTRLSRPRWSTVRAGPGVELISRYRTMPLSRALCAIATPLPCQVIASSLVNFIMLGLVFARFSAPFKRATTIRWGGQGTGAGTGFHVERVATAGKPPGGVGVVRAMGWVKALKSWPPPSGGAAGDGGRGGGDQGGDGEQGASWERWVRAEQGWWGRPVCARAGPGRQEQH